MKLSDFNRLIDPLKRRVYLMVGRGRINGTTDSTGLQRVKLEMLAGEVRDLMERLQQYGFTSRPLDGAEGLAVFHGGNREHGLMIACDDRRYRIKNLEKGEVAIYTDEGDKIHLKRNGLIDVVAATKVKATAPTVEVVASTKVILDSPLTELSGDLQVDGSIHSDGGIEADGAIDAGANITAVGVVAGATLASAGGITGAGFSSDEDGNVEIDGNLTSTGVGTDLQDIKDTYNSHGHTAFNTAPTQQL